MINQNLKKYIEQNILPIYQKLDKAHSGNHVYDVINKSFEIAKDFDVNLDMVYTIAAFHDIGLIKEREHHHLIGGKMLVNDQYIPSFFSKEALQIMQEAVEDHRASSKTPPRSIYGKIICEADRSDTMDTVIERTILFRMKNNESFESIYPDVIKHIQDKYGENGYLKVWLKTSGTTKMLTEIRKLLQHEIEFKQYAQKIYEKLKTNGESND